MTYTLVRTTMDKRGTLGILNGPNIPTLYTLEEPWQNNVRKFSCIPAGTYECKPHAWGPDRAKFHFQQVWEVTNVKDRTAILIHAGNSLADTEGCILVGREAAGFTVKESRIAINAMRAAIGARPFTLIISEAVNARR